MQISIRPLWCRYRVRGVDLGLEPGGCMKLPVSDKFQQTATERLQTIVSALCRAESFDHPVGEFEILETHISYLLLTGNFVYKLKKPVDLGFLDFRTLEKRKFFLDEELRLNRRLAQELYLDVVPVTGYVGMPVLGGHGPVLEYALKMRQFAQQDRLDRVLQRGELSPERIDELAGQVAVFHQTLPEADLSATFGTCEQIRQQVMANFEFLSAASLDRDVGQALSGLDHWTRNQLELLEEVFLSRHRSGAIRECHGDMHLGNMALFDGRVVIFDCIEFNATLRWIDVISEIAFLLMDLDFCGRSELSSRFLNKYLEHTGDYPGLMVLDFYRVYRALVRAKVTLIQYRQSRDPQQWGSGKQRIGEYIRLAERYSKERSKPRLLITHGLSGAGKSVVSERLVEQLGAILIRSDIERKRLFGLPANSRSGARHHIYRDDATDLTYERLRDVAGAILSYGYTVIVDATFLRKAQRLLFVQLAKEHRVPFTVLDIQAPMNEIRARIVSRRRRQTDASEADLDVLAKQLQTREHITDDERAHVLVVNTGQALDIESIAGGIDSQESNS